MSVRRRPTANSVCRLIYPRAFFHLVVSRGQHVFFILSSFLVCNLINVTLVQSQRSRKMKTSSPDRLSVSLSLFRSFFLFTLLPLSSAETFSPLTSTFTMPQTSRARYTHGRKHLPRSGIFLWVARIPRRNPAQRVYDTSQSERARSDIYFVFSFSFLRLKYLTYVFVVPARSRTGRSRFYPDLPRIFAHLCLRR